jgi:hypothetical protein
MKEELFNILLDSSSKSIKRLHIMQILYIFWKSAMFIYIRTQAFAVHTKYYVDYFY